MSRRRGASIVTSRPPMWILPPLASSRPAIIRRSVVLPHPEGPTRTMNSPSPISNSTPSTARTPLGKTFVSWSSRISATAGRLRALGPRVDDEQAVTATAAEDARAGVARLLDQLDRLLGGAVVDEAADDCVVREGVARRQPPDPLEEDLREAVGDQAV